MRRAGPDKTWAVLSSAIAGVLSALGLLALVGGLFSTDPTAIAPSIVLLFFALLFWLGSWSTWHTLKLRSVSFSGGAVVGKKGEVNLSKLIAAQWVMEKNWSGMGLVTGQHLWLGDDDDGAYSIDISALQRSRELLEIVCAKLLEQKVPIDATLKHKLDALWNGGDPMRGVVLGIPVE